MIHLKSWNYTYWIEQKDLNLTNLMIKIRIKIEEEWIENKWNCSLNGSYIGIMYCNYICFTKKLQFKT